MKTFLFRTLFFLSFAHRLSPEPMFNFVVWQVGQGAWSTYYTAHRCLHFDMGGEKIPWSQILQLCGSKQNEIYVTHEDWDHINSINRFHHKVANSCLYYPKKSQRRYPRTLPTCPYLAPEIRVLSFGESNKDRNASSVIYLLRDQVLITGDAPKNQEKIWARQVPRPLAVLLLGHHGSNTSTSAELLTWAQPIVAIASARQQKYGHPHPKVLGRLKKQRVSMLRTETLGSIFLKID